MKKNPISQWCSEATQMIKFPPDREAVQDELKQHLLDKQADLREHGVPEEEIEAQAVAAMGSAEEIAPQLAAIHRPFWGYAYRVCCLIFAIVLTVSLPFLLLKLNNLPYYLQKPEFENIFTEGTVIWRSAQDTQACVYDYRLTLMQSCLVDDESHGTVFMAQLKVQHPKMYNGAELMDFVWAEDSLGNVYHNTPARSYIPTIGSERYIHVEYQRYLFWSCFTLRLHGLRAEGVQWIDLHYDRDGVEFTIRIDFPGGGPA